MLNRDNPIPATPGAEQGFSLVELLVAMTLSIIVVGALLAILEVSLRQESRISAQVQANRTGRKVLSNIIDELHSSCTGFGTTAIQAPSSTPTSPLVASNALNLWFLSGYGTESSGAAIPTKVTEHDISWSPTETSNTGQSLGTLTDYSFTGTGEPPNWTFPTLSVANASAKVLGANVVRPSGNTIFQYYKYNTSGQLLAQAVPLTTSTAPGVDQVTVSFIQAPEKGDTRAGRTAAMSDSVLLRFGPSETGSEAVNTPCS